jgi:hypothetical protein
MAPLQIHQLNPWPVIQQLPTQLIDDLRIANILQRNAPHNLHDELIDPSPAV